VWDGQGSEKSDAFPAAILKVKRTGSEMRSSCQNIEALLLDQQSYKASKLAPTMLVEDFVRLGWEDQHEQEV
jgi:hypothetical protein